jgi:hypothetical protein
VAKHDDGAAEKLAGAAEDSGVFAVVTVAGEFDVVSDERGDVIEVVRAILVPRDLRLLERLQLRIDRGELAFGLGLEAAEL